MHKTSQAENQNPVRPSRVIAIVELSQNEVDFAP
jgi:hypothetical protein